MDLVASGAAAPTWLGYLIAAIELFGGLAILFGIKTRWVACALVAWVVIATALGHPFWTMEGRHAQPIRRTSIRTSPSWQRTYCLQSRELAATRSTIALCQRRPKRRRHRLRRACQQHESLPRNRRPNDESVCCGTQVGN